MNPLIQSASQWWSKPFNSSGDAVDWVLFLGLLIIGIGFWQFVLIEIVKET